MRRFAVYVDKPEVFERETGCVAIWGELYKVYPEVRPVDQEDFERRGLRYLELEEEPNYDTHQWNPRHIRFEHRNLLMRAVERMTRRN